MSSSDLAGERGLRASPPSPLVALLALLLVACGGPEGSDAPRGATTAAASAASAGANADVGGGADADAGSPAPDRGSAGASVSGELARLGGVDLEVAPYPVETALAAEGGGAIASMLSSLGLDPADVELTLAVAPGGDPTVSDWRLPGVSADAILEAWAGSAPGTWSPATLDGVPALSGSGPDGSTAWAVAADGRFAYIRTDDHAVAAEAAAIINPDGD